MIGDIRPLDQHVKQCAGCKQYRHVGAFREFRVLCQFCEADEALDREIAEADDRDIEAARDVVNIIFQGKRTFDMGKSYQVKARLEALERNTRVEAWVDIILAGKRPGFVDRKGWRIVQQRLAGKAAMDIGAEELVDGKSGFDLEFATMKAIVGYAEGIADGTRAPIHVPEDHPQYHLLTKGLAEEGGVEVLGGVDPAPGVGVEGGDGGVAVEPVGGGVDVGAVGGAAAGEG
jgi:hypothetical protein